MTYSVDLLVHPTGASSTLTDYLKAPDAGVGLPNWRATTHVMYSVRIQTCNYHNTGAVYNTSEMCAITVFHTVRTRLSDLGTRLALVGRCLGTHRPDSTHRKSSTSQHVSIHLPLPSTSASYPNLPDLSDTPFTEYTLSLTRPAGIIAHYFTNQQRKEASGPLFAHYPASRITVNLLDLLAKSLFRSHPWLYPRG